MTSDSDESRSPPLESPYCFNLQTITTIRNSENPQHNDLLQEIEILNPNSPPAPNTDTLINSHHHGQSPDPFDGQLKLGAGCVCPDQRPCRRRTRPEKQKRGEQESECCQQQQESECQQRDWDQPETSQYQRIGNGGGFTDRGAFSHRNSGRFTDSSRPPSESGFISRGCFDRTGVAGRAEYLEGRRQRKVVADGEYAAGEFGQHSLCNSRNATPSTTPEIDSRRITGFERRAGGESANVNRCRIPNKRNENHLRTPEDRSGATGSKRLGEKFVNRCGSSGFDGGWGNWGGGACRGSSRFGEGERRGEVPNNLGNEDIHDDIGLGNQNIDMVRVDSCNSPTNLSCPSDNDWVDNDDFGSSFFLREGSHRRSPGHGADGESEEMPTLLGESNAGNGGRSRESRRKSGGSRTDNKLHDNDDARAGDAKISSRENTQQNHSEVQLTQKSPEQNQPSQHQANTAHQHSPQRHAPHQSSHRISQTKNQSEKHPENRQQQSQQPVGKKSTLSLLHNEMGHRRSFVLSETQIGDGGLAREAAKRMRESAIQELRANEEANHGNDSGNAHGIPDTNTNMSPNPNMLHHSSMNTNAVPHSFLSSNSLLKNVGSAGNSIVGPGNGLSGVGAGFTGSARNSIIGSSMNLMMGSSKLSHSLGGKRPGRSSIVVGGGPGGNRSARNSVVIDAASIGGGAIGLAVAVATTRMESGAHTILAEANAGGMNSGGSGGAMTNGGGVSRRMSVSHNVSQGGGGVGAPGSIGGQRSIGGSVTSVGRRMSLMTGHSNVPGAGSSITRRMSISHGGGNTNSSGNNGNNNSGNGNGSGISGIAGGNAARRMSITSGANTKNTNNNINGTTPVTRRMSISAQICAQNNAISGGPNTSSVLPTNNVNNVGSPNPNRRMSISQQQKKNLINSNSGDQNGQNNNQNNTIEEDESWKLNFGINPISKQPTNPNRGGFHNGNSEYSNSSSGRGNHGNARHGGSGQNEVGKMESNTPKFNVKSVRRGSVATWKTNHRRCSIAGNALGRRMSRRRESNLYAVNPFGGLTALLPGKQQAVGPDGQSSGPMSNFSGNFTSMGGRGLVNPSMAPPVGKTASYVSSSQFIRRESIVHEDDIFSKFLLLGRQTAGSGEGGTRRQSILESISPGTRPKGVELDPRNQTNQGLDGKSLKSGGGQGNNTLHGNNNSLQGIGHMPTSSGMMHSISESNPYSIAEGDEDEEEDDEEEHDDDEGGNDENEEDEGDNKDSHLLGGSPRPSERKKSIAAAPASRKKSVRLNFSPEKMTSEGAGGDDNNETLMSAMSAMSAGFEAQQQQLQCQQQSQFSPVAPLSPLSQGLSPGLSPVPPPGHSPHSPNQQAPSFRRGSMFSSSSSGNPRRASMMVAQSIASGGGAVFNRGIAGATGAPAGGAGNLSVQAGHHVGPLGRKSLAVGLGAGLGAGLGLQVGALTGASSTGNSPSASNSPLSVNSQSSVRGRASIAGNFNQPSPMLLQAMDMKTASGSAGPTSPTFGIPNLSNSGMNSAAGSMPPSPRSANSGSSHSNNGGLVGRQSIAVFSPSSMQGSPLGGGNATVSNSSQSTLRRGSMMTAGLLGGLIGSTLAPSSAACTSRRQSAAVMMSMTTNPMGAHSAAASRRQSAMVTGSGMTGMGGQPQAVGIPGVGIVQVVGVAGSWSNVNAIGSNTNTLGGGITGISPQQQFQVFQPLTPQQLEQLEQLSAQEQQHYLLQQQLLQEQQMVDEGEQRNQQRINVNSNDLQAGWQHIQSVPEEESSSSGSEEIWDPHADYSSEEDSESDEEDSEEEGSDDVNGSNRLVVKKKTSDKSSIEKKKSEKDKKEKRKSKNKDDDKVNSNKVRVEKLDDVLSGLGKEDRHQFNKRRKLVRRIPKYTAFNRVNTFDRRNYIWFWRLKNSSAKKDGGEGRGRGVIPGNNSEAKGRGGNLKDGKEGRWENTDYDDRSPSTTEGNGDKTTKPIDSPGAKDLRALRKTLNRRASSVVGDDDEDGSDKRKLFRKNSFSFRGVWDLASSSDEEEDSPEDSRNNSKKSGSGSGNSGSSKSDNVNSPGKTQSQRSGNSNSPSKRGNGNFGNSAGGSSPKRSSSSKRTSRGEGQGNTADRKDGTSKFGNKFKSSQIRSNADSERGLSGSGRTCKSRSGNFGKSAGTLLMPMYRPINFQAKRHRFWFYHLPIDLVPKEYRRKEKSRRLRLERKKRGR